MASFRELRPRNRPAKAGGTGIAIIAFASATLIGAWLFAIGPHSGPVDAPGSSASFLQHALGASHPAANMTRRPKPGVAVAVERRGTVLRRNGHALSLSAVGAGRAAWNGFENGASRPTPFGRETVTIGPERTEEFLTIDRRVGVRTWRWQLGTTLEPKLSHDGSIDFEAGAPFAGLRIAPAAILDSAGDDVTPAGTRWSLERAGLRWNLSLRLDDAELPVPYVIDPATDYPTPLYLSSTAGSVTGSQKLVTAAPSAADTATSTRPASGATGYYQFNPGAANTTAAAPALNGKGWLADFGANNGSTGFPTGNWTFTVTTDVVGAATGGTAVLTVAMWKGTIAGGVFTSTGNVLPATDDPAAKNIVAAVAPTATTVTISVAKFKLAANETLLIEMFRRQTAGYTTGTNANRQTTLSVNDGVSLVTHPAADDVAPTHTMSLTPVTGGSWLNAATQTAYYKGNAVGSFTLSDALSDAGSGPYSVTYPAIGTAGWTHAGPDTSTTSPNFTSTTYSWTASPTNPAAQAINGADNALNAAAVYNLNFATDITAPANPTGLALVGGPYYTSASVGLTPTDGADGGSGIDTATRAYERDTVNLAGDTCPAFSGAWAAVTLTAGADTTVVNGKCYRYRYKVSDHVGNQTAGYSPISGTAKVDLTKPVDPTFAFSSLTAASSNGTDTVWYKPTAAAGAFTITATSSDPETSVSSYTFPAAASGWTRSLAGAAATYSHTGSPTDPAEPNNVTSTNDASNASNPVSFTVTPDPNAPTGMSASITGGYSTNASVHVTLANGSDGAGESGIDTTSGVVERDQSDLSNGGCAAFPGAWSTVTLDGSGNDTTVASGKCYVYRYKISDRVGNQGTQAGTSSTAKVDTDGPLAPTFSFSGFTNAWANGSGTVYFKGNAAGGFTVTPDASDPESGVASYTYPTLGGSWSNTGGAYTFDSSSPDPSEPNNVHGVNGAGLPGTDASFTVTKDSNAPTGMSASIAAGYHTSASIHVTLANGTDGAGESGVDPTSGIVERDQVNLAAGSCPAFTGSWTTVTLDGSGDDTTVQNGKCYVYRYKISDHVGNQGVSGASGIAKVDTDGPLAPTFTFSGFTNAWANGSGTVFFKGNAAGGFTVTPTASDPESGVPSYAYPALGSGWTAGGAYTFNSSAVDPAEPNNVHGVNGAGTSGADASFTVTKDSNAPSGMSASITGGYSTNASVHVTLANGSDGAGESGIDTTSGVVERDQSDLSNGGCAAFPGAWSTVTLDGSGNDTTVASGKCYVYRYKISDRVGNQGTQAGTSSTAKVDTDGPLAPTFSFSGFTNAWANGSGTVYFKGNAAGGFTVTPDASDPESGVASYTYPTLGGSWSNTGGAYTFDSSSPDPSEPNNVHGVNGAGLPGTDASFTVTKDSNAPTGMSASVTAGYVTSSSVAVTLANGSDGESGLDVASGVVERDEAPLVSGSCDLFPGSWSTVTLSGGNDTSVQSGKCYVYRYKISDRVGNQGASAASSTVKVDTTPPTAPSLAYSGFTRAWENGSGTVYFKGGAAGGFTVTGTATDPESGVASYVYPALGSGWNNLGNYSFSSAADPAEPNNVHAVNGAGVASGDTSFTVTIDSSAPTGMSASVSGGYATSTSIPVTLANGSDTGSGLDTPSGVVERDETPLSGGTCDPFPGSWSTVTLSGGSDATVQSGKCYRYRYSIYDRVGNQGISGASATVKVDTSKPSAPSLTFSGLSNAFDNGSGIVFYRGGAAGSFTVAAASTDDQSGIASTSFPALGSGWSESGDAYSFAAGAADPSEPNNVHTTNGAGLDSDDTSFTVTADSAAPTTTAQCDGAACAAGWYATSPVLVTLAAGDGAGAGVSAIRYTTDGSDPTVFSSTYSTPLSIGSTTQVKFRAWDNVGNLEAVGTVDVKVDATPPSAPALTLSESSPSSFVSGTTLYYNPSGSHSGSFSVDATTSDGESGLQKVSFPALAGMTGGGEQTSGPYGDTYAWTASSSATGSHDVTATNNAGLSESTGFTVTPDTTAPSGGSVGYPDGWNTGGTIAITTADGTDGGSGLDASSTVLERESATVANGSCDSFDGTWTPVSSPDTPGAGCYHYRYRISDNVGNERIYTSSNTAMVDTSAPAAPSLAFSGFTNSSFDGSTVWFRAGSAGGFTVTPSSSDAQSGIGSYAYPALGSGWSNTGGDYSFTGSAGEPGSGQNVHAVNGAGASSPDTEFTVSVDATAPATTIACDGGSCAAWAATGTVSVTLNSSDEQSGLDHVVYTTDGSDPTSGGTTYSGAFSLAATTTVKYAAYDQVGNVESVHSQLVQIDATAPPAPSLSFGGFIAASAAGSTVYYNPSAAGGSFDVTASSADAQSAIAGYTFPAAALGWTRSVSGATATYAHAGSPSEPGADQEVTAQNGAGLSSAPTSFTVTADSTAPSSTIACDGASCAAGWYTNAPVSITLTATDAGSDVDHIAYSTDGSDPIFGGSTYTGSFDVSSTTTVKYAALDNVGNAESVHTRTIQIDSTAPSAPTLAFSGLANAHATGSTVYFRPGSSGGFTVTPSSTDAESGVASYAYPSLGTGWSRSGGDYSFDTTAGDPTEPNDVTAENNAGLTSGATSFAVTADSTAPVTAMECDGSPCGSGWATTSPVSIALSASDGGAGAKEIRYTTDGSDPVSGGTVYAGPFSVADSTTVKFAALDEVGNVETLQSKLIQIDTTPPSAPTLGFSDLVNASVAGSTVYYRSGSAGGFTVTAASTDAQSGVSSYSFPALGTGWSGAVAGADDAYTFTGAAADPSEPNDVRATNAAGLDSAGTSFTVTADGTAPSTSVECDGGACPAGWFTTSPVSVALAAADGGSGVDHIAYTTDGSDPTAGGTTYSGALTIAATTTLRYAAYDNVGNVESVQSKTIQIDTSAPSTAAALANATGSVYLTAGTAFYRPGGSGGFDITAVVADAQSGVEKATFPSASGFGSGGDVAAPGPYSSSYSYSGTPGEPGSVDVVGHNNAGLTSTDSVSITPDGTVPTSSISCDGSPCGAGWMTSAPVTIALAANDTGSGLDHIAYTTDGSDPTSGGTTYSGPFGVGASTTVKWAASDHVGNVEAVQLQTIQIDTTAPTAPTLNVSALTNAVASGNTVYFRPGIAGGFDLSASSTDSESGVASYSFPALGAGWSASGTGAARSYSFTNAAVDPAEPNDVTATNNAGQSSTATSLTVTADSSAPTGGGVDYVDGFRSSASVSLTLDDGTDSGAGLDTTSEVLERSIGTLANGSCTGFGGFATLAVDPALAYADLTVTTGHCYAYRYTVQDHVGNARTYTTTAVAKIDLDAPAATQGNPGLYLHGTVTLTGTATDTGGSDVAELAFQYSDDGGATWKPIGTDGSSPYSVSFDTTTAATPDGMYDLRTVATDNAGNSSTSPTLSARRIDNTPPSASISSPAANVRGVVSLNATVSDSGSGIATTAYQFSNDGGATWTATPASWNTALTSDGIYSVRVVATDNAGNQATDTSGTFRIDNTPPVAILDDPGAYLSGTVSLTSTATDAGSGVATVTYERSPAGADSWTAIPATWNTTLALDGLYDLRVAVVDNAGNRTNSALQTSRVDNTKPSISLDNPASSSDVAGTVTLSSTASDAGSGLAGPVTYEYRTHPAGTWTTTPAAWDTTLLPDGGYDLVATAVDRAGNSKQSNVADNVRVDNTPPTVAITAPADGGYVNAASADPYSLAATANDAGSGVKQVEFFQCSDTSAGCATGTWSSVGVQAAPGPFGVAWPIPADGHRALRAVATDNADRTASSLVDVTVDRTPPDTEIVTKPGDPSNEASPSFTFSSDEADSSFECSLDGAAFTPCQSPDVVASLTDGMHDFAVRAIDLAGNTDGSPATWTWLTDLTPPTATMDNPGANVRGVVSLTSSQDDPGGANASGVASVSYEYSADDGTSWAPTTASWDTTPITDGLYKLHVVVVDNAGNQMIDTLAADVRVDNTAPSSSQDDPGQYLRQTITLTGSAADPDDPAGRPGSGVTEVRFEVSPAGADTWTAIGTAASPPYSASLDTATLADGHYDFRTVATDAAGNEAAGGAVANRLVDNTAPTASMGDPGANLRGTVTLASTTADPGADASGVSSVDYEVSSGGGWTPVPDNWSTTSMPDGLYDLRVTATDRAGNSTTSSTVSGRRVDNTPPSTSDDAPSGYSSSDVTVHLSASDSGSGVSVTEYSVDGGGFQAGSSVTIPAPSNGSNDGTHTISYFSADTAGNIEATKSTTVQIDATPPVCPSCTASDYMRGTETLSASPSGSLSGIKSVTFEYADAGAPRTLPPPGTWHTIGVDTTAPYSVGWNTGGVPDGAYDLRILIKNNANNTTVTYLDSKVVDNTAPTAGVGAPAAGALVSGSVTFAATTSDANPISSVEFLVGGHSLGTVGSAPYRMSWDTTSESDGSASLSVVVTDIAGNSTTSGSRSVTIDNNAPQPTLAGPGAGISGSVTLTASSDSDTVRVDIQRSPAGTNHWTTIGSPTSAPFSASFDTTFVVDGSYDLRAVATDQSGHVGTSPVVTTSVDNTAPTASLTRPAAGATIGGPAAQLTASASDTTSGVASVQFQFRPTGGGGFSDIADDTSSPYAVSWDASTVATGSYDLRVVATDAAGNVATSSPVTVNVDSTAPLVVLDDPGANLSGTVTLTATTSGSPASRVTFERSPAGASNWTAIQTDASEPWSAGFDTTAVPDGLYDLRAIAADALGNQRASVRSGIRVDNGAPSLVSSNPADGSVIASANSIVLVASESLAAIDGATFDGAGVVSPILSGAQATYPVGSIGPGPHTLAGILRDASGKTRAFQVHFTIWTSGGGSTSLEENSARDRSTTVTAPGDGASVTMPAGAWPANGNDWIVVRIEMNPAPSGLAGPLTFESGVADVTAHWALSGAQLHTFQQPLTITIASSGTNVAGATFDGSKWRVLRRVPTRGTLPAGWSDGYWSDSSGVHILTLHLSQFAVVRDLTPPATEGGSSSNGGSGSSSGSSGTTTTASASTTSTTTTTTTTAPRPQTQLSVRVAATKVFRVGHQLRIGARIVSTTKATGTVTLRAPGSSQLATWAFNVKAGANVLTFKMPGNVGRPGRDTLSWRLVAAGDSVAKTTRLTISRAVRASTAGSAHARLDVVLAATGFSVRSLGLPRGVRVLKTSDAIDAFDLTAAETTNVQIVVLDVDRLGLSYLHDLHTVFPTVRIVAIANDPAVQRRAIVAGAAVALPHTAGPARVGAAVRRLAGR
jgi:hypothetical protein